MERIAIVARLKEGSHSLAAELVTGGPPFDLDVTGLARHTVYLPASEVVFVFEGHQVEWMVNDLIIDGPPRIARAGFDWERDQTPAEAIAEAGDPRALANAQPGARTY